MRSAISTSVLTPAIWQPLVKRNGEFIIPRLFGPVGIRSPQHILVDHRIDIFQPSVPFDLIAAVFGVMAAASWHTFRFSTGYMGRVKEFFEWIDTHENRHLFDCQQLKERYPGADWRPFFLADSASTFLPEDEEIGEVAISECWPLENVWLGMKASNQTELTTNLPEYLSLPSKLRWLSLEPLKGPVSLGDELQHCISEGASFQWITLSGGLGKNAAPMHPDWVRNVRDECLKARIPFMFRGWGEWRDTLDASYDLEEPTHAVFPEGTVVELASPEDVPIGATPIARRDFPLAGCDLDDQFWMQIP